MTFPAAEVRLVAPVLSLLLSAAMQEVQEQEQQQQQVRQSWLRMLCHEVPWTHQSCGTHGVVGMLHTMVLF
jgi:hypothetical protein